MADTDGLRLPPASADVAVNQVVRLHGLEFFIQAIRTSQNVETGEFIATLELVDVRTVVRRQREILEAVRIAHQASEPG